MIVDTIEILELNGDNLKILWFAPGEACNINLENKCEISKMPIDLQNEINKGKGNQFEISREVLENNFSFYCWSCGSTRPFKVVGRSEWLYAEAGCCEKCDCIYHEDTFFTKLRNYKRLSMLNVGEFSINKRRTFEWLKVNLKIQE
jgi:hypothetical protein